MTCQHVYPADLATQLADGAVCGKEEWSFQHDRRQHDDCPSKGRCMYHEYKPVAKPKAQHIHFGIIADSEPSVIDPEQPRDVDRDLPLGFITDGDSFLEWGEHKPVPTCPTCGHDREQTGGDWTLHVIWPTSGSKLPIGSTIKYLRRALAVVLQDGERLADYVVVSDADDWSANTSIWTLDGTTTRTGEALA